jgi:hypothetical protein
MYIVGIETGFKLAFSQHFITGQVFVCMRLVFASDHTSLRASPPMLSIWPCTANFGWGSWVQSSESTGNCEKSHNSFQSLGGAPEQSNNSICWLLLVSNWLESFDWSKWFAISSLPPTCSPSFSFMGGVGQKLVTKTWMWEIFCKVTYLSVGQDALIGCSMSRLVPVHIYYSPYSTSVGWKINP